MNQQLAWVLWVAITAAVYVVVGATTGVVFFVTEQLATAPPFEPEQLHVYDVPPSVTEEDEPEEQRFDVGAKEELTSVAAPQLPFVGVNGTVVDSVPIKKVSSNDHALVE
jgi:hypothetical protein